MLFGRRVDVPGGRRRTLRDQVVLAAAALGLDGARSVVIADVSPAGAKLQGRNLPRPGEELLLKVGMANILALVAWNHKEECGVTFEPLLDSEVVDHLKREARWATVTGVPDRR